MDAGALVSLFEAAARLLLEGTGSARTDAPAEIERPGPASFLRCLADPDQPPLAVRTAVIVAHPDDETIGLGGQLPRFLNAVVVHVTDGAPRDLADAERLGFATREAYAAARRRELEAALALAGIGGERLIGLGVVDKEAMHNMAEIARELAALFDHARIEAVVTHAYEGGHPDHDAACWAVHAAASLAGARAPFVIEMPLYHLRAQGRLNQQFADPPFDGLRAAAFLPADVLERKRRMFAAHRSQAAILAEFTSDVERFRLAPSYDFSRLPNDGRLLYETFGWGISGGNWLDAAARATEALNGAPR